MTAFMWFEFFPGREKLTGVTKKSLAVVQLVASVGIRKVAVADETESMFIHQVGLLL